MSAMATSNRTWASSASRTSDAEKMTTPTIKATRRTVPSSAPRLSLVALLLFAIAALAFLAPIRGVDAFASFFVDRTVACYANLEVDEIVMNSKVIPSSDSREPGIRLELSPGDAENEWIVRFVLPPETTIMDVQYVLEMSGGMENAEDGGDEEELDAPASFTEAPHNAAVGCSGRRTHGRANSKDTGAMLKFNGSAQPGARVEVWGGWATGHEPVTLTERVAVVLGKGVVAAKGGADTDEGKEESEENLPEDQALLEMERGEMRLEIDESENAAVASRRLATVFPGGVGGGEDASEIDDGVDDKGEEESEEDLLEEENILERERGEMKLEIDEAEKDAYRALEEKREDVAAEREGKSEEWMAEIDAAEEEVVEAFEGRKEEMNRALNDLKEKFTAKDFERQEEVHHARKTTNDYPLKKGKGWLNRSKRKDETKAGSSWEKMRSRIERVQSDPRAKSLEQIDQLKEKLEASVKKLHGVDKAEHAKHKAKPSQKGGFAFPNLEQLREKVKKKLAKGKETVDPESLKNMREKLKRKMKHEVKEQGNSRKIRGASGGDGGEPMFSSGLRMLLTMFGVVAVVGAARWYLDRLRKKHKGRRTL